MNSYYPQHAAAFGEILRRVAGQRVAVIGHARPDGDCIGSQVALARALASRGVDVVCINGDPVPRRLQYLVTGMNFLRTDAEIASHLDRVAIYVDCADQARVGERLKAKFPKVLACIDHHLSNVGFAEYNLLDAGSAATCVAPSARRPPTPCSSRSVGGSTSRRRVQEVQEVPCRGSFKGSALRQVLSPEPS